MCVCEKESQLHRNKRSNPVKCHKRAKMQKQLHTHTHPLGNTLDAEACTLTHTHTHTHTHTRHPADAHTDMQKHTLKTQILSCIYYPLSSPPTHSTYYRTYT